jgi:hypothetical protein
VKVPFPRFARQPRAAPSPYAYGSGDGKRFTTFLTPSPAGDELTLGFAEALVEPGGRGRGEVTAYLAISVLSHGTDPHPILPNALGHPCPS